MHHIFSPILIRKGNGGNEICGHGGGRAAHPVVLKSEADRFFFCLIFNIFASELKKHN
jgi:hypothetical protein